MALANVYVQTYGQIADFFAKIQEGQAPDLFTNQHLKDIGFTSSNHRAFIRLLKALGFLSPEGAPTSRYHEYRSKAQARRVIGEAVREAYADLFVIKEHPTDADRELIEGKFKSAHNVSDRLAKLMANTFYPLLALADLDAAKTEKKPKPPTPISKKEEKPSNFQNDSPTTPPPTSMDVPSLHYNIQIHLPATKDIEVFGAIFKSLKEHLLE